MHDVLKSTLLDRVGWIEHGFGTRLASISQNEMASLEQIHSSIPVVADRTGSAGEGDAVITSVPGLAVSIRTADCLPILAVDTHSKRIAAIHAGWRGTAARIVVETLEKMGSDPRHLYIAIGPGIGACCYEVGEDVARRLGRERAGRIDLAEANRAQLIELGLLDSQIDVLNLCTLCDAERFHSYRRDGEQAGRMISYIRVRKKVRP